ncbi:Uncharacterized protein dnl_30830 [Desulfonema limicola]|uniref:STAS domain-containing protein n=1 Tax=Desulfonema limicola TaxID=45656 RepID=A0A975B8L1_9BACT|nr:hypothetical protein [Desulfonema limicola]QTA80770.1 Uncharacterized protein dnl_30830 [Desulfonema limicola]
MKINHPDYHLEFNPETGVVSCAGSLELRGKQGYAGIAELLKNVMEAKPPVITLDIRHLEFLNTTGITTFGGFIIGIRKTGASRLKVLGAKNYPWQARAFKGLQKLLPAMEIEFK